MKIIINKVWLIIALMLVQFNVSAEEIPKTVTVQGQKLILNGTGMRTKFFFDIYEGALYTSEKVRSLKEVLATGKNVRIAMHIRYREVGGKKLREGFEEGFEKNMSAKERKKFVMEVDSFKKAWTTIFKNNIANIDFSDKGVSIIINDRLRAKVNNPEFNEMVLRIWLGKEPAQEDLKEGMLGLE